MVLIDLPQVSDLESPRGAALLRAPGLPPGPDVRQQTVRNSCAAATRSLAILWYVTDGVNPAPSDSVVGALSAAHQRIPYNARLRAHYWQVVPGVRKTWWVMAFVCDTPSTEYAKVALFPSLKVIVAVPTWRNRAPPGLPIGGNEDELNGGPLVGRNRAPV